MSPRGYLSLGDIVSIKSTYDSFIGCVGRISHNYSSGLYDVELTNGQKLIVYSDEVQIIQEAKNENTVIRISDIPCADFNADYRRGQGTQGNGSDLIGVKCHFCARVIAEICKTCGRAIHDGEPRYRYVSGTRCADCVDSSEDQRAFL